MNKFQKFDDLYEQYNVKILFRDRIYGGRPKNKEMLGDWIRARTGFDDAKTEQQIAEARDVTAEQDLQKEFEKSWTGFASDEGGIFIESRALHAMIKQCASLLRITVDKRGSKQILAEGFVVHAMDGSNRLRMHRGTTLVAAPDGYQEDAIHVSTPQGDRTALRRQDYVKQASLEFQVWWLRTAPAEKRHLNKDDMVKILTLAQHVGLGASRSQDNGQFDVISFEPV